MKKQKNTLTEHQLIEDSGPTVMLEAGASTSTSETIS